MADGRHGKDEPASIVAWLRARLAETAADRDRLARDLAEREKLDRVTFAADGTGPLPVIPAQRTRHRRSAGDRTHLRLVKLAVPAVGLGAALRWAWHAHRVASVAAGAFTVTAATTAAVAVAPHGVIAQALGAAPAASMPDEGTTATPLPVVLPSGRLIVAITRPAGAVPGLDSKSTGSGPPGLLPVPSSCCYTPPSQPPAQQQQPAPDTPAAPAGPPALQLSATTVDLTGASQATVTITAAGDGGWASWRVDTTGTDLVFSPSRGVLQGGQSVTVTVSLAATQDGAGSETFTIAGQQVTVTLPVPAAPAPADTPTVADSAAPVPASS